MNISGILDYVKDIYMSSQAKSMGYDPSDPKAMVSAMNIDYNDMTNPANANGPAYGFNNLNVGQIIDSVNRRKKLEDLLDHFTKKKTGK